MEARERVVIDITSEERETVVVDFLSRRIIIVATNDDKFFQNCTCSLYIILYIYFIVCTHCFLGLGLWATALTKLANS